MSVSLADDFVSLAADFVSLISDFASLTSDFEFLSDVAEETVDAADDFAVDNVLFVEFHEVHCGLTTVVVVVGFDVLAILENSN